MMSQALVPSLVSKTDNKALYNVLSVLGGVLLLSLLAQVYLPLTWTPVPITGQTLGVALVALMWGLKRGGAVLALYLGLGSMGAPVFAMGTAGLLWGPTLGYLVGMFFASIAVGYLSDKGFTNSFSKTLLACYLGSAIIFACGLFGLSFFVSEGLFVAGMLPFLIGDLIKNTFASLIYTGLRKKI